MNGVWRGIKNAFRNKIRTVSIVSILGLSMGLALSMLVANQAVTQKIEEVKSSVGNTVSISPAGARGFEGGGDPLTTEDVAKVSRLDHVTSVTKTLSDRVTTDNSDLESAVEAGALGRRNAGNSGQDFQAPPAMQPGSGASSSGEITRTFTPPVTVIGTTTPSRLATSEGSSTSTLELTDGELFASDSSENVALVGKTLAEKNNLSVGSTFILYGETVAVVGIFDTGSTFSNNQVIVPLTTLQTLSDQADALTSLTLNIDSIENVTSVTSAAKAALGDTADVTNASEQAESTISPLKNIQTISAYSLIAAVGAASVIVLLTMIMIARERHREIGVLKAIGASNIKIAIQFAAEAVTFTLLATLIGLAVAAAAAQPLTSALATSSSNSSPITGPGMGGPGGGFRGGMQTIQGLRDISAQLDWTIILYGFGAAMLIAGIGSLLTAFFIAKVRPAEVMRAE